MIENEPPESRCRKRSVLIEADAASLATRAAELVCRLAAQAVAAHGSFTFALPGGASPRGLFGLLSQEPYLSRMPWFGTHLFWVDERMVPYAHEESNFGTAKRCFLDRVPLDACQMHPIPVERAPEEAAARYQAELEVFFHGKGYGRAIFDLILLGVGQDGHVASLFPRPSALADPEAWVIAVKGGTPDLARITLTYAVLNEALEIVFLVHGREKAPVVGRIFQGRGVLLPAQRILPRCGHTTWLLDRAAAVFLGEGRDSGGEIEKPRTEKKPKGMKT